MKCIISCEHASNRIPPRFARIFLGKEPILSTHRGYDPGAAGMARRLAHHLKSSLHLGTVSRLLVDLNRSPSNRKALYSTYSRNLAHSERDLLLQKYYVPYRKKIEMAIDGTAGRGEPVLHISIHTFSPVKDGRKRKADMGLLYDPGRSTEKALCSFLAALLREEAPHLLVRKNYPYLGKSDGFTAFLRRKHPARLYAGVEIEMNQALWNSGKIKRKMAENTIVKGIRNVLDLGDFSLLPK